MPNGGSVARHGGQRRAQYILVMVQKTPAQLRHGERCEGKHRRHAGRHLRVDLGGDLLGSASAGTDTTTHSLATVTVVDVPAAVMAKVRDAADAETVGLPSFGSSHLVAPGARNVHQLCTREDFCGAKETLSCSRKAT